MSKRQSMTGETRPGRSRTLGELLAAVRGAAAELSPALTEQQVTGVTDHSEQVGAGTLFVAVAGASVDGHALLGEAAARGAAAFVVEHEPAEPPAGIPLLRVPDSRRALAELAAAWHGHPAQGLPLIGISGTIGKTSVLSMLEAIARAASIPLGSIGSLGVGMAGELDPTGYTAPDALRLHGTLAELRQAGAAAVAMEVTSHALTQRRVHGLALQLGVFTNLVPFEHMDYHRTFRGYVDAKAQFFDLLEPGAPLIYNVDDRAVRGVVRDRPLHRIGCGMARTACVRVVMDAVSSEGIRFDLDVRRPLPRLDGGTVERQRIPIALPLLGRSNALNAGLAAAAALWLGAEPDQVQSALAAFPAARRRMEIVHRGDFLVLDDTVGHPDSLSAVFEVVEQLGVERIHIVFGIRGMRGVRINRRLAETLAIWVAQRPATRLFVTTASDTADERNRVQPREHAAFTDVLRGAGIAFEEQDRTAAAVAAALEGVSPNEIVLLLGAQGLDRANEFVQQRLRGGPSSEAEPPPGR
jgi:UDP-N-acetylmuramoyl-L-alanyl-D-glutamate--2,6-diaminopimelate ligase